MTVLHRKKWQYSVNSLITMVHSLLESNEEIRGRLDSIRAHSIPIARDAIDDTESLLSSRNSILSHSRESSQYQQLAKNISQNSSLAATRFTGLDTLVNLDFQQSRTYSRIMQRHSISSLPGSYNPASRWSTLSDVSLAEVSNISVLSLPRSASEIWGSVHYVPSSTSANHDNHDTTGRSGTKIGNNTREMLWNQANIGKSFRRRSFASIATVL